MSATHSPAEWAQMTSLAFSLFAACSSPYFLLVDAEVWLWPRPLVAAVDRVHGSMKSGRLSPVWQPVVDAGNDLNWVLASGQHYVREFARDACSFARLSLRGTAFTATALLALLVPAPSESAR